jgi:hypothetical protein
MRPHRAKENRLVKEELLYTNANSGEPSNTGMCIWRVEKKGLLRIAYPDGTQFWLDEGRKTVWATWPDMSSLEETSTYLLGPVLGILLRLRGTTCLHASAVNIEGQGVAFVGPAGAGKSTTAAAFARQGFAVLSDDIVPVVERGDSFLVLPAYSHLCLWPDSVNMLYGSPDALPRFSANWDKRCLALGVGGPSFESRPLPLAAIYILGDRRTEPAPCVEAVRPQSAFVSLVAESYANKILDREMRAREFDIFGRLASTVPVRRIFPHRDASRLPDLCQAIEDDFAALRSSTRTHP